MEAKAIVETEAEMAIDSFTTAELEFELERRRKEEKARAKPIMRTVGGLEELRELRELCQAYIDALEKDAHADEDGDIDHYIFEAATETFFGKDVWVRINARKGGV